MENLARSKYDRKADDKVLEELKLADIPVIKVDGLIDSEVKTRYMGVLNGFVFQRAWTYWVVSGWMPLEYAKYIYQNYKDLGIRASGFADGENPEKSFVYANPAHEKRLEEFKDSCSDLKEFIKRAKEEVKEYPDDQKFIKFYHVDTELGLKKLVETIMKFNINTEFLE